LRRNRQVVRRRAGSRTIPTHAETSPTSPDCIATFGTSRRIAPSRWDAALRETLEGIAKRRNVAIGIDPYTTFGPIVFDHALADLLRNKAEARQLATRDMIAAAGHDSVLIAPLCPSAMLFIPSVGGITHNPREFSTEEQVARGAQILLDAVLERAG
jgi:N-carbamoyl-L-amino-acid hydrolase